jgi:anti-sigma factor RsiW
MCEFSDRLIAWLDHELPDDEASGVERHLQVCEECRERSSNYEEISSAFVAYCDRAIVATTPRKLPVLTPVGIGAGLAALVVLWLSVPGSAVPELRPLPLPAAHAPAIAFQTTPASPALVRRRPAAAPATAQGAMWRPSEPAVEIIIPAEAMYPPGAVPAGFSFIADVSFAADGSPHALRLWP